MKKKSPYLFIVFIIALLGACSPCANISCENGKTCVKGICKCHKGFYGDNCELVDCSIVKCPPNSTCSEDGFGTCSCNPGYERRKLENGAYDCGTLSREKFLGIYTGEDMCRRSGKSEAYQTTITKHPSDVDKFLIDNFGQYGLVVAVQIEGPNQFSIPKQTIGELTVQGVTIGTINKAIAVVSFSYKVTVANENISEECDVFLRQQ